ncbi:MAG: hypothetical protein K5675_01625 [Lachnospiraceae bacterium]|nr:hypothetical protein [Lachnospiraceae bacterium]
MNESKIYRELEQVKQQYELILVKLEDSLQNAPPGNMLKEKKYHHEYYTKQYKDKDGKCIREYISKKDKKTLKQLGQKKYDQLFIKSIRKNLMLIDKFLEGYDLDFRERGYEKIGELKDIPLELYEDNRIAILEKWMTEEIQENSYNDELKIFETDKKEMVRSKSEVIIANALNQYSDKLLYKYERPLEVKISGFKKIIYPDFTTLNIESGEISYLEHFGMMDNPEYAEQFVKKINLYEENGIVLGKDLFVTFESMEVPLNTKQVRRVIEQIISK